MGSLIDVSVDRRATNPSWSSDQVKALFTFRDSTSETPVPTEQNDLGSSSLPVGAIAGGVIGGVALIAIAAATFFFVSRRRRAKSPQHKPGPTEATSDAKNQHGLASGSTPHKDPAELHEQYQPAEMTGQGKELPRPVHEMDGGYGDSRR
jgi:hypothetical protein